MTQLIVAGGLIPSAWGQSAELLAKLEPTALAQCLGRHRWSLVENKSTCDAAVARVLGHEYFVREALSLAQAGSWYAARSLHDAKATATAAKIAAAPANWWRVDPVHLQLATDHIKLAAVDLTDVSAADCAQLIAALAPLLDHYAASIVALNANQWFLHMPQLERLECASALAAFGRSIDLYLPQNTENNDQARLWRRFCTEVEMTWFEHPVNLTRQSKGQIAINGLWLQGPLGSTFAADGNNAINICDQTYLPRALEQPYEWVSALEALPHDLLEQLQQASEIDLILGAEFSYRRLRGVRPRWWQKSAQNWLAFWCE
jgi:hypothetical protein